jgi:hypothetical protein
VARALIRPFLPAIVLAMRGVGRISTKLRTKPDQPLRERAIARLALDQHGVVALAQLRDLGLSPSAVRSRVSAGRLHRVHRGVYAVGHAHLATDGRWIAAVLACGPDAVLSHRSAAALWRFWPGTRPAVDVTAAGRAGYGLTGIHAHRATSLRADDRTRVRGIPCTSVARTLLDLAEVVDRRGLERAINEAEVLRLFDLAALEDVLACAVGRRGAPILRSVLAAYEPGYTLTRNELEKRFRALCDSGGIPRPRVNAWIPLEGGGVEVDFLWRAQRLIAETDGRQVHGTSRAFERDRRRDQRLLCAGWHVVRFSWRQVTREPRQVARTIQVLLGRSQGAGDGSGAS